MSDNEFLQRAVALSVHNVDAGQGGPFGAVVAMNGRVIGEGVNQVTSQCDPTAHAEIVAIRQACRNVGSFSLDGASIFSSCEPCPMCLGAIYWSGIKRIVFANTRREAAEIGFDDSFLYEEFGRPIHARALPVDHRPSAQARKAFELWRSKSDRIDYAAGYET